jgi:hypothetical protein
MKTLYKFVSSPNAVLAIAGGSLKFTDIPGLNDPSELVPAMNHDAVRSSLAVLREDGYTPKQFEWLGCQEAILRLLSPETMVLSRPASIELANRTLRLPIFDDLAYMEEQLLKTVNLIRSRVGVFSLTERFDSLPMWAHYAAQANGYVMRFDDLGQEFPGDATGSLNTLAPVHYVNDLVGMTHDPSTQNNLFFCKFQDWSYEREWRVVSALSACSLGPDGKMHLRSVSRARITGVICGWNVPAREIHSLETALARVNPGIQISVAELHRGRVTLPHQS